MVHTLYPVAMDAYFGQPAYCHSNAASVEVSLQIIWRLKMRFAMIILEWKATSESEKSPLSKIWVIVLLSVDPFSADTWI